MRMAHFYSEAFIWYMTIFSFNSVNYPDELIAVIRKILTSLYNFYKLNQYNTQSTTCIEFTYIIYLVSYDAFSIN